MENIFLHFKKEQRNKGSTDDTAKGHITILHSQSISREAQTAECFHWDWHRPGFNGGEKTSTFQCVYGHVFQWLFWSLRVTYPSHSYALGWSASMWSQRFSSTPKRRPPFSSSLGAGHPASDPCTLLSMDPPNRSLPYQCWYWEETILFEKVLHSNVFQSVYFCECCITL